MRSVSLALLLAACATASEPALGPFAIADRDRNVVREFMKEYPPPPWRTTDGEYDLDKCQVDHAIPLYAGGPDAVWNVQYQRREHAAEKDKLESEICRRMKMTQACAAD